MISVVGGWMSFKKADDTGRLPVRMNALSDSFCLQIAPFHSDWIRFSFCIQWRIFECSQIEEEMHFHNFLGLCHTKLLQFTLKPELSSAPVRSLRTIGTEKIEVVLHKWIRLKVNIEMVLHVSHPALVSVGICAPKGTNPISFLALTYHLWALIEPTDDYCSNAVLNSNTCSLLQRPVQAHDFESSSGDFLVHDKHEGGRQHRL